MKIDEIVDHRHLAAKMANIGHVIFSRRPRRVFSKTVHSTTTLTTDGLQKVPRDISESLTASLMVGFWIRPDPCHVTFLRQILSKAMRSTTNFALSDL